MSECHKSNSDSVQTRENGEEGEGVLFAISIYSTDARFNTIGQDLREANSNVPGSPSDLNTGNGTEGATGCPSWCRPLRPLFHFLCSNLKANPVHPHRRQIYSPEMGGEGRRTGGVEHASGLAAINLG